MSNYKVRSKTKLELICSDPLKGMFKLSPFVWKEEGSYHLLIRAVNPSDDPTQKVARIYYGQSADGIKFRMSDSPVLVPSINAFDKDGCEDPTVIQLENQYLIFYTGWNQTKQEGQLLLAQGTRADRLSFADIAIPSKEPYLNPKEATVTKFNNDQWLLFFEYANEERSKLGFAISKNAKGPWEISGEFIEARIGSWDAYDLSPGPVITDPNGKTVMFYNGSIEGAHWRIGWLIIDENVNPFERGERELIAPTDISSVQSDIAFAASAVLSDNEIWLYYTMADDITYRAVITA